MQESTAFLSKADEQEIVAAIVIAEKNTSGEIRVHIEENSTKPSIERAKEVFHILNMDATELKNGVLFYICTQTKSFAILGDKDVVKFLNELAKVADEIIVTRNSSPRAMPIEDLKRIASDIFEEGAVSAAPSIAAAIQEAVEKASQPNVSIGVLVTGSVVTAGAARALLKRDR